MKTLHFLLLLLLLSGCSYFKVPLQHEYPSKPLYGYSDKSVEEVWKRLINVITDEGLDLKFIDKTSGFVLSDDLSIVDQVTIEDKNGKIINPGAFVVSEKNNLDYRLFIPDHATAKWSVVIREAEGGRTAIKIALSAIHVKDNPPKVLLYKAHSLGNFENWLFEEIK